MQGHYHSTNEKNIMLVCVLVTTTQKNKMQALLLLKKNTHKQKPQNPNKKLHIQPPLNPNYWINACVCIYVYSSIVYLSLVDMNNPTYPHIWSHSNTSMQIYEHLPNLTSGRRCVCAPDFKEQIVHWQIWFCKSFLQAQSFSNTQLLSIDLSRLVHWLNPGYLFFLSGTIQYHTIP